MSTPQSRQVLPSLAANGQRMQAFKEEERAMERTAAGCRKRMAVVGILIGVGMAPLTGCAVPRAGEDGPPRQTLQAAAQPIKTTNFYERVLRSDAPVLVDFYATWCGPCKRLAPTLEEVAAESPGIRVVKVNVDESPELAERYDIHSMPSLMVFKDGQVVARQNGVVSKARLKALLDL